MTNHGFIDPTAPERERMERLELLITEALSQLTVEHLSPEAQAILGELRHKDDHRREAARRQMKALMDADPLPERCSFVRHDGLQCVKWDDHIEGIGGDVEHRFDAKEATKHE